MASNENIKPELGMPMPPPLLHTRSGNEMYYGSRPDTPSRQGFTSPVHTPQGSPSKNRFPPGSHDLPNVFDNAMKLNPTSPPARSIPRPVNPASPSKPALSDTAGNIFGSDRSLPGTPGSPTRKTLNEKENTPPATGASLRSGATNFNAAAASRQEQYLARGEKEATGSVRKSGAQMRGLTPEELEKLQLPKVKRLANVTQLCESE